MANVRVLTADDWSAYRVTRLDALRTDPDAFGSSFAHEAAFTEEEWRVRVTPPGGAVFGIDGEGGLVATGAVITDWTDPDARVLVAMWTGVPHRGLGLGRMIVEAAIAHARGSGAASIRCSVTEGNGGAARLYASCGFVQTGESEVRESDGLLHSHLALRFRD
ncbi:MAG: hypothetical protein RLZZ544_1424 [Actinomycetota bacterium]